MDDEYPKIRRKGKGKKWLGILCKRCNTYTRIYKAKDGRCYKGNCLKCGLPVKIAISSNGSPDRFFAIE